MFVAWPKESYASAKDGDQHKNLSFMNLRTCLFGDTEIRDLADTHRVNQDIIPLQILDATHQRLGFSNGTCTYSVPDVFSVEICQPLEDLLREELDELFLKRRLVRRTVDRRNRPSRNVLEEAGNG
jgi:hypothetical protein